MSELDELKEALAQKNAELLTVRLQLIDNQICTLRTDSNDHEDRLRIVETSRVRFETLAWLAFGGGALSLINIIAQLLNVKL